MASISNASYQPLTMGSRLSAIAFGQGSIDKKIISNMGRCDKIVSSASGLDKLAKATIAGMNMAIVVQGSSVDPTVKRTHDQIKSVRNYMAPFKAIGGMLRVMAGFRNTYTLASNLNNDQNVALTASGPYASKAKPEDYNKNLATRQEKAIGLASSVVGVVADGSFTVGFGVCKSISLAEHMTKQKYTSKAGQFSGQIGKVMLAQHIAAFVKNILDWVLEHLTFGRYVGSWNTSRDMDLDAESANQAKIVDARHAAEIKHTKANIKHALDGLKYTAELVQDVTVFAPMPPVFKASTMVASATFDIIALWATA
jgi:hypothetical protein